MEKIIVKLPGDREVVLKIDLFGEDTEIEADDITQIDYANLLAEIATAPTLLNRLGLLLAEMDSQLALDELKLRLNKAKIRKLIRTKYVLAKKKFTNDVVDDDMRSNLLYKTSYETVIATKLDRDRVSSIYWSMKAKVDNLNKLSLTIQAGDINLDSIKSVFNGIELRTFKDV